MPLPLRLLHEACSWASSCIAGLQLSILRWAETKQYECNSLRQVFFLGTGNSPLLKHERTPQWVKHVPLNTNWEKYRFEWKRMTNPIFPIKDTHLLTTDHSLSVSFSMCLYLNPTYFQQISLRCWQRTQFLNARRENYSHPGNTSESSTAKCSKSQTHLKYASKWGQD